MGIDLRVYSIISDPLIIITDDGFMQFANPSAERWLSLAPGEGVKGKHIDEFLYFHDAPILTMLPSMKAWQKTPFTQTVFDLKKHGYKNIAKIAVQCLPYNEQMSLYAIIVRDKVFFEGLWEDDRLNLGSVDQMVSAATAAAAAATPAMVNASAPVLNAENLAKAMPTEVSVMINMRAILVVPTLKLTLKCQAIKIADNWIDMAVKSSALKPGLRCTIELMAGGEVPAFTCAAFIDSYHLEGGDTYNGRFRYDNMSASAKKIVTNFLEKNAVKF